MKTKYTLLTFCLVCMPLFTKAQTIYSLADCERMAIENNHQIRNGNLEIKAATQTRREAFTSYFPSVSGTGTYFNANQSLAKTSIETQGLISPELAQMLTPELIGALPSNIPVSLLKNGTVAGVIATQPIFAGGRIINSNKLAKVGEEVARLQLELTEDEVVLTVHTYYYQVVNLKDKLETIGVIEDFLNTLEKDVEISVKAGMTTRNDLLRVELQQQDLASNRLKVENGIRISKMLLAQFIGAEIDDFDIGYNKDNDYQEPWAFYRDAESAVTIRTEVKLLDQTINAETLKKKMSLGDRLPSVGIGGGYLYNDLLSTSNNSGVIFATVSVPVSDWWGGSHAYKKHKIIEQQAINNKTNKIELMMVETNQTWNELTESYKQILLAESSIRSATENLRIVKNSYRAGVVPLSELLDAQVLFQQSKNQHTDACSVYQIKTLRYRQITGS